MSEPLNDSPETAGWSIWLAGLSREAKIVMAVLGGLVLLLVGVLLGTVVGGDSTDGVAGGTETSLASPSAVTTAAPVTSAPSTSTPAATTLAATTTTAPVTTTTATTTTAPVETTTTATAPTTTTAPTTSTTAPTTTTTLPVTLVIQAGAEIEVGQAIDLDTGAIYTITLNPDFFDPVLAAAVDVKLDEVLIAGVAGYNVVVSPLNGAVVTKVELPDDSCISGTGIFNTTKVFVHWEQGVFDGYYCFITTEGNFTLMSAFEVTGTQDPVVFLFFTFQPPGFPGS